MSQQESRPARVLVICHQPDVLSLFTYALRDSGYDAQGTSESMTGLEQCIDDPPDILIVQHWVNAIDAVAICKRIRSDPKACELPILVFQVIHESDFEPILLAGATACFGFPFDIGDILAQVSSILAEDRRKEGHA